MYVDDVLELVEKAVDEVFKRDIYLLKMYDVLKNNKSTQKEAIEYLASSTIYNVTLTIDDLDHYITLGKKDKTYGEAYGYLSKPQARKIRDYLQQIVTDTEQYVEDRKPGRKKGSKNKTRSTSNK